MKREASLLLAKACDSLILSIELFNRRIAASLPFKFPHQLLVVFWRAQFLCCIKVILK